MKKLYVLVQPNAKQNLVKNIKPDQYKVFVKAPPKEGKANKALLEILSRYLSVPKSKLILLSGHQSKRKVIGIK